MADSRPPIPAAKSPALPEMTFEPEAAEVVDTPDPTKPTVPAHDYRLAGDRRLAQGWKARARDNLAAIRLMTAIEAEGRHARPDEQEQPGEIHGLRRHGPRRQALSPRRRRLRPRMGRSRPRARGARLARGSRESQAGDAIRAFHAGVHDPRHLAGAARKSASTAGACSSPVAERASSSPSRRKRLRASWR